jgi:hypothetical protein
MANDPASLAFAAQVRDNRYKADMWLNVTLPPMMKLWKGVGGAKFSDFFVSEEDAREAKGAYVGTQPFKYAATVWRFAQVEPHPEKGYRGKIMEFVVDFPIPAAVGICLANPNLGSGSVLQYFVPNWDRSLRPTRRTYRFDEKNYPKL